MIARESRDAEMSAQMQQVKWADGSVDGDEVDVGGAGQHHHGTLHVGMLEAYPYIGTAQVAGVMDRLRRDHMLPAMLVVLLADGFKTAGIVKSGHGELVAMHGDAVQLGAPP